MKFPEHKQGHKESDMLVLQTNIDDPDGLSSSESGQVYVSARAGYVFIAQ